MELSLILLIGGAAAIIIALLTCFFGYRLARFVQPISGLLVIEGLIYLYVYQLFVLDAVGTWMFFAGTAVAFYVILFVLRRVAAFFTAVIGTVLFLVYVIYAFNLHTLPFKYPVLFTLAIVAGLLAFVYKRVGVVLTTALFGGCVASYIGLYMIFVGVGGQEFISKPNLLVPLTDFMSVYGFVIVGTSLVLGAAGAIVQLLFTAKRQTLSNETTVRKQPDNNTWVGGDSIDGTAGSGGVL